MITAAKGMLPENPKPLKKLVRKTKSYVIPNPMFEDDMKKHKVLYDLALSQLTGQFLRGFGFSGNMPFAAVIILAE